MSTKKIALITGITAQEMCAEMLAEDLRVSQRHALLKQNGPDIPVPVE